MTPKQQQELLFNMKEIKHDNKLELIRMGFESLKQKMEDFEITEFLNEVNYAQNAIERESTKLEEVGEEYKGISYLRKTGNIVFEVRQDERENGPCTEIENNVLRKTEILEKAEKTILGVIFNDQCWLN